MVDGVAVLVCGVRSVERCLGQIGAWPAGPVQSSPSTWSASPKEQAWSWSSVWLPLASTSDQDASDDVVVKRFVARSCLRPDVHQPSEPAAGTCCEPSLADERSISLPARAAHVSGHADGPAGSHGDAIVPPATRVLSAEKTGGPPAGASSTRWHAERFGLRSIPPSSLGTAFRHRVDMVHHQPSSVPSRYRYLLMRSHRGPKMTYADADRACRRPPGKLENPDRRSRQNSRQKTAI